MNHQIPTATIYLGTPFFNEEQQERVKQARALLEQNPTVLRVHFLLIKIMWTQMKQRHRSKVFEV